MKNGDISNRGAPIIAFRVEGLLLSKPEKRWERFLSRFPLSDLVVRKLNMEYVRLLNYIWRRTDYTINLYSFASPISAKSLEKRLSSVHYSNIFLVSGYENLRKHLESQYTVYYIDVDEQALSVVGNMGLHVDEINKIIF